MNPSENFCKYCSKEFNFKYLYDRHIITCEFFYQSRRRQDIENSYNEQLPSAQEQFKLIQYLTLKVKCLEDDVSRLKINAGTRKRKLIIDLLNNPTNPKPSILFDDWYKQIDTDSQDMDALFEGDITDSMISILERYILSEQNLPICSFQPKPNSIYIWTTKYNNSEIKEPIWVLLTPAVYNTWLLKLEQKILELFLKWQRDNALMIKRCDKEKEKNIATMRKVNGITDKYDKKRQAHLHKWIYTRLAREIEFNTEYV
jgi:hypothetical protein